MEAQETAAVASPAPAASADTVVSAPQSPTATPSTPSNTTASPDATNAVVSQPEAYSPNYKFKVLDKEQEFDEWLKPVVKNKEHETKLKELYEKAHGLDHVKTARDQVKNEYQSYKQQWEPIKTQVTEAARYRNIAMKALETGDVQAAVFHYENAFKHLGISDKELQQYVIQKMQMDELPQNQKQDYNRRRELESNHLAAQDKLSHLEQQNQQLLKDRQEFSLEQALSKPDIAPLIQAFNQESGDPNAFRKEVIKEGIVLEQFYGRTATADELVSQLVKKYRLSAPQAQAAQQPQAPVVQQKVPVIPAVKGGASSPTATVPQSIAEMKKLREQKFGS